MIDDDKLAEVLRNPSAYIKEAQKNETSESEKMTLESAPVGTIVLIGHWKNNVTATKRIDHEWYCNLNNRIMDLDPRDVSRVLYTPAKEPDEYPIVDRLAARVRVAADEKLGRETPELIRRMAEGL